MQPLVSVIVPVFNSAKYLKQCLDSILNQSYQELEVLVCDDGSSDQSFQIIESYRDRRMRSFQNGKNKGVVTTRNFLIEQSQGKYIAIQDSDDWSHPDRILKQVQALTSRAEIKACGTNFLKTDNKGLVLYNSDLPTDKHVLYTLIPNEFPFLPGSLVVEKDCLRHTGMYNPYFGNDGNEDIYLISKLVMNMHFLNLPEHLYYYRLNPYSLTKLGRSKNFRKFYIPEITKHLLLDYKVSGTNLLEKGEVKALADQEILLSERYLSNPNLVFDKNIGALLYWNQYLLGMKIALMSILENGWSWCRIKMVAYIIRRYFKHILS